MAARTRTAITYVDGYKKDALTRIYVIEIIKGLWLTAGIFIRNFLTYSAGKKGSKTIYYPEELRADISPINRGKHVLVARPDGTPWCVACMMCETICPAECIHITAGEHQNPSIEKYPVAFNLELDRCIYCGFCVEACPEDAIRMSTNYHLAEFERFRSVLQVNDLLTWNPTVRTEPIRQK